MSQAPLSRRQQIESMLAQQTHDQFLRYMLAMEVGRDGQEERCMDLFRGLMTDATPHVPSFLMAAQRLVANEDYNEARSVLRDGIDEARKQGESHAAAEMSELLQRLGAMGE